MGEAHMQSSVESGNGVNLVLEVNFLFQVEAVVQCYFGMELFNFILATVAIQLYSTFFLNPQIFAFGNKVCHCAITLSSNSLHAPRKTLSHLEIVCLAESLRV